MSCVLEAIEANQTAYWRRRLEGAPALSLPTVYPRQAVRSTGVAVYSFPLPCSGDGATVFNTVLAAYSVLLHRYTGQSDLTAATPALHGRSDVVLRMEISGEVSFQELILRVQVAIAEARLHEAELNSDFPAQVSFGTTGNGKYEVSLTVKNSASEWAGELVYSTALYDESFMARMAGHLLGILEQAAIAPSIRVSETRLLQGPEEDRVLGSFNETSQARGAGGTIHGLFEEQVLRTPNAMAAVSEEETLTYFELNRRANLLARRLRQLGVSRGTPVGVLMRRSAAMVAALLAVMKAGGAYVPLDPAYPAERLRTVLDDCQPACLITDTGEFDGSSEYPGRVLAAQTDWSAHDEASGDFAGDLPSDADPGDLAYLIYTSGSTGKPKGVMIEHRSAVELIRWAHQVFSLESLRVVLASTSLCFDLSIFEIFVPLSCGTTIVVTRNILDWSQKGAGGGVTLINTVPSALKELVRARKIPAGVKVVNVAGEALARALVDETFAAANGIEAMYNLYGPSEDTTYSTFASVTPGKTPLIGRPVSNTRVYIVDQYAMPVPIGIPGEICIGGAGLARGYWDRPELTAEKFIPDAWSGSPGSRLYRTGDLGHWTEAGDIEFLGRLDHQVKIRGHRIELGEIEAALKSCQLVENAVVVAREDSPGDKRLAAYVVLRAGAGDGSPAVLRAYLKQKLPEYMAPSFLILLDEMPLTPNGKVDRRKLPAPDLAELGVGYVAPATVSEELLAGIWQSVLGCARVGAADNFFELGGHSLLAMQTISRIREVFGVEISLQKLFQQPVLRDLAQNLAGITTTTLPVWKPERGGALPLSFGEQRLYFLQQFDVEFRKYNMAYAFRMTGRLHAPALQRALQAMIERHDILRTRYILRAEPERIVDEPSPFRLRCLDAASEAEATRLTEEESRAPFDLERGPLLRALLIGLTAQEHALVVTMHHVIGDAWSMDLWARDLSAFYAGFLESRAVSLPDLPLQYADYALWQREHAHAELYEQQLAYWTERLKDAPILDLPTVHPRPSVQGQEGALFKFAVPEPVTSRFQELRIGEGATLFIAVLAAFKVLLYRYSGQTDLLVGTPISGRSRVEFENLFGYFLNTLALRTDLSSDPTFRDVLRQVRDVTIEAYAHQDLPFERVVQKLHPDHRDLSRPPLIQVALVVQHAPKQAWDLPGLEVQSTELDTGTAKFDVALFVTEGASGWTAELEYSTDLFDESAMARMADHFRDIVEQVAENPNLRIADIALRDCALNQTPVPRSEVPWSEGGPASADQRRLHELFEEQALRTPDADAVVFGNIHLSYAELNRRANQLARYLQTLAGPQSRIAVRMRRSIEMIVAVIAALKAGAAFVPIDPEYPEERQRFMLEDARAAALITHSDLAGRSVPAGLPVICIDKFWPEIARQESTNPGVPGDPDDLLYLIYTSGSTGRPKGVALPHRALVNLVHWYWSGLSPAVRILQFASLCFDVATLEIFSALGSGGTVVMTDESTRRDAAKLAALISEARVQQLFLPVVVLDLIAHELSTSNLPLPELKEIITAGEQLQITHAVRQFFERTGCSLHNHYGPSEAHVVTGFTLSGDVASWPSQPPIGRPIDGTRAYIVDGFGNPAAAGAPGEILIGGVALARGYWDRPDLTAERFIPDGISGQPGARLYRTGDLGKWNDEGQIDYLGRLDHQVKIRGHRIELGEIESVLASHPAVEQTIVVVTENTPGDKRLAAYLVFKPDSAGDTLISLRSHLKQKLPEYMIPAFLMPLTAMPLTANGKIDRRRLPVAEGVEPSHAYLAPQTLTESRLVQIWQDVLGVPQVGISDNFFEMGGHSLLAMQLASRMLDAFHLRVPLHVIFSHPTVQECAAAIDARKNRSKAEANAA